LASFKCCHFFASRMLPSLWYRARTHKHVFEAVQWHVGRRWGIHYGGVDI
jgi:hypothetical protein